jgi:hypothetical protein
MKRFASVLFTLALGAGLSGAAAADETKAPSKKPAAKSDWKILAAPDVKFVDVEGMKGAQAAALWGDMKKGAHGTFIKWPSGFDTGWHRHSHLVRVVVVQGTLTIEPEGQAARDLGAGSYFVDPANSRHRTGCKAGGTECVFFITQSAAFDMVPDEKK